MAQENEQKASNAEATNENAKTYQFSMATFNVWCPHWNDAEKYDEPKRWKARHRNLTKIMLNYEEESNTHSKPPKQKNEENAKNKNNEEKADKESENSDTLPAMNCDLYCLQEFWCDREDFTRIYETHFKAKNYALHSLKRAAKHKPDGLAVLYNKAIFECVRTTDYKYSVSNRVAIIMELRHKASNCLITVACTHLTYPQDDSYDRQYLRPLQIKEFLQKTKETASKQSSVTILAGDFNCEIDEHESKQCIKDGYQSSFHVVNPHMKGKKIVSHINHESQAVFVDHIFFQKNANAEKEHSFSVKPVQSYLYPEQMKVDTWCDEWTLSDHRPVVTTFQLQRD
eukprot:CAMPEP_0197058152 /NCGR_PEP_ID=MMETSP1384-20130603/104733_1 /TAXON_ID=29189 /ORGANISM="Ammonia sp." /LENGTH=341 /DNA_ID=CAMNT_0042492807 /DNA_START=121 /DNA_END=1146 /DNA_ORIENTATION=+